MRDRPGRKPEHLRAPAGARGSATSPAGGCRRQTAIIDEAVPRPKLMTSREEPQPPGYPMEMRRREMRGWLRVDAEHVRTEPQLSKWVQRGITYARSRPPK